jgi:hypothetical protein
MARLAENERRSGLEGMMSDDMVKELREFSVQGQDDYPDWYPEICEKAAAEIDRLRALNAELVAALESLTKEPPRTMPREPDEDWEVVVKMRAIARAALSKATESK